MSTYAKLYWLVRAVCCLFRSRTGASPVVMRLRFSSVSESLPPAPLVTRSQSAAPLHRCTASAQSRLESRLHTTGDTPSHTPPSPPPDAVLRALKQCPSYRTRGLARGPPTRTALAPTLAGAALVLFLDSPAPHSSRQQLEKLTQSCWPCQIWICCRWANWGGCSCCCVLL